MPHELFEEIARMSNDPNLDVSHMAIMQAISHLTDAVGRMNDHAEAVDRKLDDIKDTVHKVDRRVVAIEANTINSRVEKLELTMAEFAVKLAADNGIMTGRAQAAGLVKDYWPLVVGSVMIVVALMTGGQLQIGGLQ